MIRKEILDIPGNRDNIKKLTVHKSNLVPFIGAGFSVPACPQWGHFLENFFQSIKEEFLMPEQEEHYLQLKEENRFEEMADFLVDKAKRRKFEEAMKAEFDKPPTPGMKPKFQLLHRAFPGLKITTNFDCLVENSSKDSDVITCYGSQPEELDKWFTKYEEDVLLKIHGGLRDIHSVVLALSQYQTIYGHPTDFGPDAPLPRFLTRVFTNKSLLFTGCSLARDRTIKIMESLRHMRPHFAIMLRPTEQNELVELNRRLSDFYITPIWITNFSQIEAILGELVETPEIQPLIEHEVPFVGRKEELNQIKENLEADGCKGSVHMITGRLFSIEGAGGVGKTSLALEAAKRFASLFTDGVLPSIRVDEHSPMSFAMHLAGHFNLEVREPSDAAAAQALVTWILKDRNVLLIMDNAVDWKNLRYMLPAETCSTILVTTRSREMYRHIRLAFSGLALHEIQLEKFTPREALDLFKLMLGKDYKVREKGIYLEIAGNLGFLPLALGQAIALMLFGPHYTAAMLRDKLAAEDRLGLLRKGKAAEESDSRTIEATFDLSSPLLTPDLIETLEYLAICSPGPVRLDFLQRLAKDEEIGERLERLYAFSWCERRERDEERFYELHQLVRELVFGRFGRRFEEEFIQLVHDIFTDESVHFSVKEELFPQLEEAFLLAKQGKDKRLKNWLYDIYYFCTYRGFADFYIRLAQSVAELFPGDKWALRTTYAHRALIYQGFGKLEEAMTLHKKQEKNSDELGDRAGLAACYGNQALILKAWGKLDEAMTLHKKEEKICDQLGDRAGLAKTWWNQGLIYNKKKDYKKQIQLWRKSIEMNKEIGIPTEEDEKRLEEVEKEKGEK